MLAICHLFGNSHSDRYKVISHCGFDLHLPEYIMRNTELEETQAGIKIARRNINNLRYADDTALYGRK